MTAERLLAACRALLDGAKRDAQRMFVAMRRFGK
jgi:hypothetical protein